MSGSNKLIEALVSATEDDLAEIDARVTTLESELTSLREVRDLLRRRFGVTPTSAPAPAPAPAPSRTYAGGSAEDQVIAAITISGPASIVSLMSRLRVSKATLYGVVKRSPRLALRGGEVHLLDESPEPEPEVTSSDDNDGDNDDDEKKRWPDANRRPIAKFLIGMPDRRASAKTIAASLLMPLLRVTSLVTNHPWFDRQPNDYVQYTGP